MSDRSPWGFMIVGSDLVEPDTAFLFDASSVEWTWRFPDQPSTAGYGRLSFRPQVEIVAKESVVETNPLHWHRPRGLRSFVRLARAVVGYYSRKLTGRLRSYEKINAVKLVGISS